MIDINDAALKFIAYRDHTKYEMENHLKSKGYDNDLILKTIEYLIDLKYLDDYNYSIKYFEYSIRKGKGIIRIKRELINKGIDKEIVDKAYIAEIIDNNDSEYLRGLEQANKILMNTELSEKILMKIGRRLNTLGYSSEIIYKIINELKNN